MRMITTTSELSALCDVLAKSEYVAVDTEFLREQTFWPLLCLIQLAGPEAELSSTRSAQVSTSTPFYQLMADTTIVKVFHAARQDIEIIFLKADIVPTPVFDSQVAAMVCGYGDSISYVNLVKKTTGVDLDKSSRFTDWSRRPLSEKQLDYALADVTHLRDVYLRLKQTLKRPAARRGCRKRWKSSPALRRTTRNRKMPGSASSFASKDGNPLRSYRACGVAGTLGAIARRAARTRPQRRRAVRYRQPDAGKR